jgi:HAD superfamily hydrolase (TIGR01549 family)
MTIRAILFDVGGPLNTEVEHERLIDADIAAALSAAGVAVTPEQYTAAVEFAVHSYAPDAHPAIIWHLTVGQCDIAARAFRAFRERVDRRAVTPPFELREGMAELLADLHKRGLLLGLAANQPHQTLAVLDDCGLGQFFHHREVSGTHGYRKPDLRLFLRCCEDLGVTPDECLTVGDRIDNDIAPAKLLGIRAILFRTGRHIDQQPRAHHEVPDAEVRDAKELWAAIMDLVAATDSAP